MMEEEIKEIFCDIMVLDESEIDMKTPFHHYGMDSLDVVEMLIDIENEFDIEISDEDAEKFQCLMDVLTHLENHVKN
jgi:acyl carrier protein